MATLAMFHGIFIGMKPEKNVRHHRPHVHARYQGKEATFDIETRDIIAGALTDSIRGKLEAARDKDEAADDVHG